MQPIRNYLTIDVEDYFQVAAFEDIVNPGDWDLMEQRVVRNTRQLLDTLKSRGVLATFFVVGWIADKFPQLVAEIGEHGHEIGCHSYWHRKIFTLDRTEFHADTLRVKSILEGITGKPVLGYRAPSYSITEKSLWALDTLKELGFTYDSSIFPVYHDNYGIPGAPRFAFTHPNGLLEYPISTALFVGCNIPVSGGGYFRLFPYWFTRLALRTINHKETKPFVFYLHPWEIDPEQPRMEHAGKISRFRHYNNLQKTADRLQRLLDDFLFQPLPVPA